MEDVVSVQHANCNDVLTSKDALLLPLLLLLLVMADAHLNTIFFISIFCSVCLRVCVLLLMNAVCAYFSIFYQQLIDCQAKVGPNKRSVLFYCLSSFLSIKIKFTFYLKKYLHVFLW